MIFLPFCYPKFSLWYNHGMRHCTTKQDVSREWGFSQPAKMQNCHTHIYELKRGHFSSLERQYFANSCAFPSCVLIDAQWAIWYYHDSIYHILHVQLVVLWKWKKISNFLRCGLNFWQKNLFLLIWSKWKSKFRIESSYS